MKKAAILQSNYIPWKGYFDLISKVDLFIFHDDLQYTKNDWRNRNLIKTPHGLKWITIPCGTNEKRLINEVVIKDSLWQKKHWNLMFENYKKAPYFKNYKDFFEDFYLNNKWTNLSELNQYLIKEISTNFLKLNHVLFENSTKYNLKHQKGKRVIELLKKTNATNYFSGPSAKNYIKEEVFNNHNIDIHWMNYDNYLTYNQPYGQFEHQVSIVDLLFNKGESSVDFI
jgi:hypothetical protein